MTLKSTGFLRSRQAKEERANLKIQPFTEIKVCLCTLVIYNSYFKLSILFSGVGSSGSNEDHIRYFLCSERFNDYLLNNCDVRQISAELLAKEIISRSNFEKILINTSLYRANANLFGLLYSDPSLAKLQDLSVVLKSDTTRSTHQELAKRIDQFLKIYSV